MTTSIKNDRHEHYRTYFDRNCEFHPKHRTEALTWSQTQLLQRTQGPENPYQVHRKTAPVDLAPGYQSGSLSLSLPMAHELEQRLLALHENKVSILHMPLPELPPPPRPQVNTCHIWV